jgi:hypothetical protein
MDIVLHDVVSKEQQLLGGLIIQITPPRAGWFSDGVHV